MRSIHRNLLILGVALVSAVAFDDVRTHGQQAASNDYPNPYKMENFGQLPAGRKIGQTYGIDIDRDGTSVWVFERCGGATCGGSPLAPLLQFDSSRRVGGSWPIAGTGASRCSTRRGSSSPSGGSSGGRAASSSIARGCSIAPTRSPVCRTPIRQ